MAKCFIVESEKSWVSGFSSHCAMVIYDARFAGKRT